MGSTAHPHLLVGAGKEGKIYLIDRDHMGGFTPNTDNVVETQAFGSTTGINGSLNTPGFFLNAAGTAGSLYYFPGYGGNGRAFTVSNGAFTANYTSQTTDTFGQLNGTPSISANGNANGIVWVIDRGTNQLRAYDATNLANELWTSPPGPQQPRPAQPGREVRVPTVADGRVFVGTSNAGCLWPADAAGLRARRSVRAHCVSPNFQTVNLTWQDNSNNEDQFLIERSPNGVSNWNQIGSTGANATTYSDTTALATTTYYYRVRAFNSFNGGSFSPYSNVFNITTPQAPPLGTGDGLAANFYTDTNGNHLTGAPVASRVDPQIDSTTWPNGVPTPAVGANNFSIAWTGKIQPQFSENYTFYTESDDGIRVFINGQQIINDWTFHAATEDSGTIALSAGTQYNIEVDYFQGGGLVVTQLLWASPSTNKQLVPKSQLYSGVAPTAPTGLTSVAASGTQLNLSWNDLSSNETGFDPEPRSGLTEPTLPSPPNRFLPNTTTTWTLP